MGYSNKIKFIDKKFNRLILRYKLLCLLWSITCLSTGIAFVYANLHECTMDDFDIFLKTNSMGVSICGILVSTLLSANTFMYRRKLSNT